MRRTLLLFALFAALPLHATITWMRHYRMEPARAAALHDATRPVLEKLTAEGKVSGWGIAVPLSHHEEPWTHLLYVHFANWAAADAFVPTLAETEHSATVVRDVVLRHAVQQQTRSTVKPKYIAAALHWIKRGRDDDALALFNEWAKPVFLEMEKTGKVGSWALLVEDTVISGHWRYMTWYPISDLSSLDDVATHLTAMMGMPRLKSFEIRLNDMSERNYEGRLFRVLYPSP